MNCNKKKWNAINWENIQIAANHTYPGWKMDVEFPQGKTSDAQSHANDSSCKMVLFLKEFFFFFFFLSTTKVQVLRPSIWKFSMKVVKTDHPLILLLQLKSWVMKSLLGIKIICAAKKDIILKSRFSLSFFKLQLYHQACGSFFCTLYNSRYIYFSLHL